MKRILDLVLFACVLHTPMGFAQENVESQLRQNSIKSTLGVEFLVSPLENNETDTDYLATPYRPMVVETRTEQDELLYRYIYDYDKEGKDLKATGPCMVRSHLKWNAEKQDWMNDARFKAVFDENNDMTTYYYDQGDGDKWKNYYCFFATYENHKQMECSQEYWNGTTYESKLRWVNTYNTDGLIITQQYENKNGEQWSDGLTIKWDYNKQGKETYYEQLQPVGGELRSLIKRESTYDDEGNLLTQTSGSYGVTTGRFTYTWKDGKKATALTEKWDKDNSRFYAVRYVEMTYDTDGRITEELFRTSEEKLSAEETTWKESEKNTYMYMSGNSGYAVVASAYNSEKSAWEQKERIIRRYNERDYLTSLSTDSFNVSKNTFETKSREVLTYDAAFNLTDYKYQLRNPEGTGAEDWWETFTGYTYEYDGNNNCIKVATSKKNAKQYIKMPYNNMVHEWACPEADSWSATINEYLDLNNYKVPAGISFDEEKIHLSGTEEQPLTVIVIPENATNKQVHWQSLNPEVAVVDVNGQVKAVKDGTAVITATTLEGLLTASCEVEVLLTNGIAAIQAENTIEYSDGLIEVAGEGIGRVELYDAYGMLIINQANQSVYQISTEGLAKGVYIIRIIQNGETSTQKISIY